MGAETRDDTGGAPMRKFPGFNGMWMWMLSGDMLLGGTVCWLELGNGVPGNWWCGDLMASSGQVEKKDPPPLPKRTRSHPMIIVSMKKKEPRVTFYHHET